jgi:hypothetical protein
LISILRKKTLEGDKHLLHKVGGIVLGFTAAPRPRKQERRIEIDEPPPGRFILGAAQSLQKCRRRGVNRALGDGFNWLKNLAHINGKTANCNEISERGQPAFRLFSRRTEYGTGKRDTMALSLT